MTVQKMTSDPQSAWALFRFSVIGPLFSCPPETGQLKAELMVLSKKTWCHPINGLPLTLGVSTLERWYYRAKANANPTQVLRKKRRSDAMSTKVLSPRLVPLLRAQYRAHSGWSIQLHRDNLATLVKGDPSLGEVPSYSTLHRYMKANGLHKHRRLVNRQTEGAMAAAERLESREVRSYEVEHVHGLWHLDFHHGSRKILGKDGQWHKPMLLAILDDHSRLICHAQWYWDETTESIVHGFKQALQKRGLPRALMTDNGSAMTSAEFTQGLSALSILHQPTLPYSPYQNAKQEVFWAQVEGRLMAMLEGEADISLALLNEATIAWIEFEYHRKIHTEIESTPMERYLDHPNVGRPCPEVSVLTQAFCQTVTRKQRRSDGTISVDGHRFEIPSQYRHLQNVTVRYTSWDYRQAFLIDPHSQTCLTPLYPQDKQRNASGERRLLCVSQSTTPAETTDVGIAPLLKSLMAEYAATGLPPAYLSQGEKE